MGQGCGASHDVVIRLTSLRYSIVELQELLARWEKSFGCEIHEDAGSITISLGGPGRPQLLLRGKKSRKYLYVYDGKILGNKLQEDSLLQMIEWITTVQTNKRDIVGLVVSKAGQHDRPLVVHNGRIYDQGSMIDLLWSHYVSTKVREARKIEDVYYFLRDVPPF